MIYDDQIPVCGHFLLHVWPVKATLLGPVRRAATGQPGRWFCSGEDDWLIFAERAAARYLLKVLELCDTRLLVKR